MVSPSVLELIKIEYPNSYSIIKKIKGREVLDSRGNPTVEVELVTEGGIHVFAIVPSGASTGIHEACELRDDGPRYCGKGCLTAVKHVNEELRFAIEGMCCMDQKAIDEKMCALDKGTTDSGYRNKSEFGANAILGISIAVAKAGAACKGVALYQHFADLAGNPGVFVMPVPCFNVVNGGSHAGNKLAFQEYFIIPVGASSFKEAMQIGCECYHKLKGIIKKKFGGDATSVGDEGGFAPPCDAKEGCALVTQAIKDAGYDGKCKIGMDVAAAEFLVDGKYAIDNWYPEKEKDPSMKMGIAELTEFYKGLKKDFPDIETIEDPFDQDDWDGWTAMTKDFDAMDVQIVGDDLTVTNVRRIETAIEKKACTALLLKINQIGTITESINAVKLVKSKGWGVMCSHRSGETEDTTIADLAVGLCTGQIKTGAPCRSDRLAKYNQLMRIEEELGSKCTYAGATWKKPAWMAPGRG